MMRLAVQIPVAACLLAATTLIAYYGFSMMGMTGVVMLYLAAVLLASYRLALPVALGCAIGSFLVINYFFVEPRYSFEVGAVESWVALGGFLLVSVVVASLVKRLQIETWRANQARKQAQFLQRLAENLAGHNEISDLLQTACSLVHEHIRRPVAIAHINADDKLAWLAQSGSVPAVHESAVRWVTQNGKALGPATSNWSQSEVSMTPFERLPGNFPVLMAAGAREQGAEELQFLQTITDQVALAYQRLVSMGHARKSELLAREESLRNILLSSLSHDMRTPLTSILGAATSLTQQPDLDERAQSALLQSICSEAQYLVGASENILALAQLDASQEVGLQLDWQSPEEIVGSTLARYRGRELSCRLTAQVSTVALIKADATLLAQALANLIDNAIAVHEGSEAIVVEVRLREAMLEIEVKDRGAGFPPGFSVDQICKFSKPSRTGKGFGLGLAIVRAIAEAHQAVFSIAQRAGGGSVARLAFPLPPDTPGD